MKRNSGLRVVNDSFFENSSTLVKGKSRTQKNAFRDSRIENGNSRQPNDTYNNSNKKSFKLEARSAGQQVLIDTISKCDITIAIGLAGTGKTLIAVAKAVEALDSGQVKRIIITRPAVESGEKLGFLPGTMQEKLDPYMRPIFDALVQCMSAQRMSALINERTIEIAPIGFMRGRTLSECAIILDEGQNATHGQLRMILTRIGHGSFLVITGDPEQSDLENGNSGLLYIANKLENVDSKIGIVRMKSEDVVRHPLIKKIVTALK